MSCHFSSCRGNQVVPAAQAGSPAELVRVLLPQLPARFGQPQAVGLFGGIQIQKAQRLGQGGRQRPHRLVGDVAAAAGDAEFGHLGAEVILLARRPDGAVIVQLQDRADQADGLGQAAPLGDQPQLL